MGLKFDGTESKTASVPLKKFEPLYYMIVVKKRKRPDAVSEFKKWKFFDFKSYTDIIYYNITKIFIGSLRANFLNLNYQQNLKNALFLRCFIKFGTPSVLQKNAF